VNNTKHHQFQTIYVINQDKKGVGCVIVSFPLTSFFVHVVKQNLDQNQEVREYGIGCDYILWLKLKVGFIGA